MRPVDVVDILIVAWVLYRLLTLLRGTRAVVLLRGFVLLLGAAAVSGWVGLRTVNWLLERALTALLVALPVVFYPEVRRALERLGRGELFRWNGHHSWLASLFGRPEESDGFQKVVDAVVKTARELSRRRVGALIAIEEEVGLEEFVETGIRLDAVVTPELLINIFEPLTPLHDGAVIIRRDRVAAAACFLPLARPDRVERKMGSRHRAALGLAEESDALVIVISEETGRISGARDGRMYWDLGEEGLKQWLTSAWGSQMGKNPAAGGRRAIPRWPDRLANLGGLGSPGSRDRLARPQQVKKHERGSS